MRVVQGGECNVIHVITYLESMYPEISNDDGNGSGSPPLVLALRPPYKRRTSKPRPWADGQKRGVVEVGKHLCAPASRVAKSDRRCLLHRPLEPPGGHTLTGLMVPTVAFLPSDFQRPLYASSPPLLISEDCEVDRQVQGRALVRAGVKSVVTCWKAAPDPL